MHILILKYCFRLLNIFVCLTKNSKYFFYYFLAYHDHNQALFSNFYRFSKSFFFLPVISLLPPKKTKLKKPFFPPVIGPPSLKKEKVTFSNPFFCQLLTYFHWKIRNRLFKSFFSHHLLIHSFSKKEKNASPKAFQCYQNYQNHRQKR